MSIPPPPDYLIRPNPVIGVYRQIESSGHLQNDAMEISFRSQITRYFNGMIQYTPGRAYNDVTGNYSASTRSVGINAFPANNYDLSGECGSPLHGNDRARRRRLRQLPSSGSVSKFLARAGLLRSWTCAGRMISCSREERRKGRESHSRSTRSTLPTV